MKQLILELTDPVPLTLDNFAIGSNAELLHVLRQFASAASAEHFLYLWGSTASGKTHLLQALSTAGVPARYIAGAGALAADLDFDPATTLYVLDDVERLDPERQIDAFALFNQIREHGAFLVSSGAVAPAILPVREDLRTRMGWGLIYQLHALTDADKITTLQQTAQTQGWNLAPGVLSWLITHYRRDMRSLTQVLSELEQYSLETRRPMTLPLLRELLRTISPETAPGDAAGDVAGETSTELPTRPDEHESGLI